MKIKKAPLLLGLILLLGVGLRIYRVGSEGIWLDEGVTIARASSSLSRIVDSGYPDPSPPLYYLALHFWIKCFGNSELSIRLPSVIFGALAIWLIYRVGETLWNRRTGLTAAFFLALAAFPVYFSREARMYSLLLLLSLASFYCLLRLIRERRTIWLTLYLLTTAGALYTHNLGVSIVLAQNIYLLIIIMKKGRPLALTARGWYSVQGILLLLYLPGLTTIWRQARLIRGGYWSPDPRAIDLWKTIENYGGSAAAAAILCGLATIALLYSRPVRELEGGRFVQQTRVLLASWFLTPILLPFLVSLFLTPIYMPRITIAAAPALYLLAGRGVDRLPGKALRVTLTGLLGILLLLPLVGFYRSPRNEPWREVVQLVEKAAEPGDVVLVSPSWYRSLCFEHYRTRTDITTRGIGEEAFSESGLPRLREEAGVSPRTWIVYFQEKDLAPLLSENFPGRFQPGAFRVEEYFNFQAGCRMGIRIYLLDAGEGD